MQTGQVDRVIIRRAAGSIPPATINDGDPVGNVASPTNTITDTGLNPSTDYAYAFFSYDGVPNYSAAASVLTTTTGPAMSPAFRMRAE